MKIDDDTEMWLKDSGMIFTQISTSGIDNFEDATRLICNVYVWDMSITRAGICHALGRLERFYKDRK
mgnify:CR=1 FL=1